MFKNYGNHLQFFHSYPITRWLDSSYGAWFVVVFFFYKDAAPTELNPQLKNMRIDVPTRIDILKTQP